MSNGAMGRPRTATEAVAGEVRALGQEARFGGAFLRKYWRRLLLLFAVLLLPLWGFAELADEVREGDGFFFDEPVLRLAHAAAGAGFDRAFVLISALGYEGFVVPFDVGLVLALALLRRAREGLFAGLALGGSALLNLAAKHAFARVRPSLWESIAPEATFSFPSGHAMGSMTLAWVCMLLAWRTRWRWPVTCVAVAFTLLVGLSRIYLGVHFPSDILAGWAAASAWAASCFFLVFHHHRHPWHGRGIPKRA